MSNIMMRFADLTAERDKPVDSETEATGYATDDGYVHEIVSRSPNRQTVTKRVTVTKSEATISPGVSAAPTAPKFTYGPLSPRTSAPPSGRGSEVGLSSGTASAFELRSRPLPPMGSSKSGGSSVSPAPQTPTQPDRYVPVHPTAWQQREAHELPTSDGDGFDPAPEEHIASPMTRHPLHHQSNGNNSAAEGLTLRGAEPWQPPPPREVESLGPLRWVTTTPLRSATPQKFVGVSPTAQASMRAYPKSVRIGGTETTFVEPSRVSPLLVREAYAPVRYIPKRQLRALRGQQESQQQEVRNGALHVRHGSVPRLDAYLEEEVYAQQQQQQQQQHFFPQHSGREFYPNGTPPRAGRARSPERRTSTGRRTPSYGRQGNAPAPFDGVAGGDGMGDDDGDVYEDDERWESISQRSSQYGGGAGGYGGRQGGHAPGSDYGAAYNSSPSFRQRQQMQQQQSPLPYTQQYPSSPVGTASVTTTLDNLPNTVHVVDMAQRIAFSRGIRHVSQPPPQCQDAFRLLYRGTYVVKYGRQGPPHERYMAMRLVETERTHEPQPFLVWATHAEAASFKERLHLALLIDVIPGTGAPQSNFQRQLTSSRTVHGPSLGGKKSVLPTTYAFSLRFAGSGRQRTVDCLCLDDQTYHCWLMVCQYFASINASGDGTMPLDAETMAPDTPRSMSAAAFS